MSNQTFDDQRAPDGARNGAPRGEVHKDVMEVEHPRGLFEKEALEVTLEGRIYLMAALASRTREVCAGLNGHPRLRSMPTEDKQPLLDAIEDATNLATSLTNFAQVLLEQPPTRAERERLAGAPQPPTRKPDYAQRSGSGYARR